MMFAKISTARSFLLGPILDADGVAKTDEVVGSIKVTKNGSVGAAHGSSTLTHNHTGHYVYAANAGDFDTAGEVEFSLNSGTNAMAPVKFQVLPAVNFDALFATAPGADTGLMIAGSNAATTFATLDVTGACTHGSTVLGNVTAGTVTQTGAASWGATTLASMAVTGALSVGTTTTLTGAVSCGSTFDVVGALTCGSFGSDANFSVGGEILVTGDVHLGAQLTVQTGVIMSGMTITNALLVGTTTTLTGVVSAPAGIAANITGNLVGTVSTVTTLTGHTAQTGDTYALAAGATGFAAIDTVVDAILVDTAVIGALGAGLTAIPWNATWDAEVQSECTDALNAYDPPTKAEVDTACANVSVDEIQATALADLFNTDSGTTYAAAAAGSVVKEIADNAGGSALTVGDIADGVWDEALAGHAGAGTAGAALTAAGSAGDPWSTLIPGAYGAGTAGKILGDNINAPIGTVDTVVDNIYSRLGAPVGASMSADIAAVKAETVLIVEDTGTTLPATLTTISGYVDCLPAAWVTVSTTAEIKTAMEAAGGHLALILEDTGTTLPATLFTIAGYLDTEIAAILADTNELQTDWTNGGRLDLLVDAILEDTGTTLDGRIPAALVTGRMSSDAVAISGSTSAADKLELSALSIETGAAAAGTLSTTQMSTDLTEATTDHYVGRIIIWTSGVLLRQATDITAYNGTTKVLTFTAVTEAPTAADTFIIV